MSDIIDIIDGFYAEATKGPLRRSEASGVIESSDGVFVASGTWPHDGNMLVALVNNWPSISARLREAERERDEWKLASSKNGDAMSGYQSRAIVAEQQLEGAKRERDAALASLAEKQRAIDEAFRRHVLSSEYSPTADAMASILRPHATKATGAKPPRQWTSTPPKDRGGKWWHKLRNRSGSHGLWLVPVDETWGESLNEKGTDYNLWLPWQEGDTRDNLPQLPDRDTNPDTVSRSEPATPAADACDTRDLVARLAEFIHTRWTKPGSAHDWRPELEAIIAAARRGGGG